MKTIGRWHILRSVRSRYEEKATCCPLYRSTGTLDYPYPMFLSGRFLTRGFLCLYVWQLSRLFGCRVGRYPDLLLLSIFYHLHPVRWPPHNRISLQLGIAPDRLRFGTSIRSSFRSTDFRSSPEKDGGERQCGWHAVPDQSYEAT